MHVLIDVPPSVPQRGEPLVSILKSQKRQPKWARARLRGLRRRHVERMLRRKVWEEWREEDADGGNVESFIEMVSRYAHVG